MTYDPNFPDEVSDLEDQASASSLALAPWVESQALPIREAHIAARVALGDRKPKAKEQAEPLR